MENLFEQWKIHDEARGRKHFIRDGIVNDDEWNRQEIKICFFLKEAYLSDAEKKADINWNLVKDTLDAGTVKKMWHSVAEWTLGVLGTTASSIPEYRRFTLEEKKNALKKIAVINIKKSDGESSSEWEDLVATAESDRTFIRNELEIIKPDVLICGNNSSLLRIIYDDESIGKTDFKDKCYCFLENMLVIDFYHPANHFPKFMNYYSLCAIYQQALKEWRKHGN